MPSRYRSSYRARSRRRRGGLTWRPIAASAVLAVLGAAGTWYAIGRDDGEPCCGGCPSRPGQVDIAYGARQNSPPPFLPDEIGQILTVAANAEKAIVVYRVDGDPTEAMRERFQSATKASGPRDDEVDAFITNVRATMGGIRPVHDEAAPLAALTLAARDSRPGDTVILIDSGLQTIGPLNFLAPGLLLAEPADVIADLAKAHAIPNLRDRRVILLGIGDTIRPQHDLDHLRRDNLITIWREIAIAGGARCVDVLPYPPRDETPLQDVRHVTPIEIPVPKPPKPCGETVLYNGEAVGFQPREDILLDRAAASVYLRPHAQQIVAENRRVHLIGTTARWGPPEGQRDLGRRRAAVVKELLVELGVPGDRITTDGVGSYSDYYHNDNGPKGPLLPGPAALNRSVVLRILCDPSS